MQNLTPIKPMKAPKCRYIYKKNKPENPLKTPHEGFGDFV